MLMKSRKVGFHPSLSRRQDTLGLIGLMLLGVLGNYWRWSFFFHIDFLFGTIAVWLVLCLYGLRWGAIAAITAASVTYFLWHHPYAIIIFACEFLFVGLLYERYKFNLVVLNWLYWLLIGMPLVWLCYRYAIGVEPTQVQIIMLKQAVNGIFNALTASLLLTYTPLHRWLARPAAFSTLSLQQTLFNILVAFVFFPTLIFMAIGSHQVVKTITAEQQHQLQDASTHLYTLIHSWHQQHQQAMVALEPAAVAVVAGSAPTTSLQQQAELLATALPDFQRLAIANSKNEIITDASGTASDGATPVPFIPMSPAPTPAPRLVAEPLAPPDALLLQQPLFRAGQSVGTIWGQVSLDRLQSLMAATLETLPLQATLLDTQQHVITSTVRDRFPGSSLALHQTGEPVPIDDQTYQWLPTDGSPLFMVRWRNSLFVMETPLAPITPWTLVLESPAQAQVQAIETFHIRNLAILLGISGLAFALATLVSRQLVRPLSQLAQVTHNLPNQLLKKRLIAWPQSPVYELTSLVRNFQQMATTLTQKFQEIQQAKQVGSTGLSMLM